MRKNKSYDLHPEAQREIEESYYWYSQQSLDTTIECHIKGSSSGGPHTFMEPEGIS